MTLCGLTTNAKKRLAVLDRLTIFDVNLDHFTNRLRLNLIHQFHRFNDTDNRVGLDVTANLHERIRSRRR